MYLSLPPFRLSFPTVPTHGSAFCPSHSDPLLPSKLPQAALSRQHHPFPRNPCPLWLPPALGEDGTHWPTDWLAFRLLWHHQLLTAQCLLTLPCSWSCLAQTWAAKYLLTHSRSKYCPLREKKNGGKGTKWKKILGLKDRKWFGLVLNVTVCDIPVCDAASFLSQLCLGS